MPRLVSAHAPEGALRRFFARRAASLAVALLLSIVAAQVQAQGNGPGHGKAQNTAAGGGSGAPSAVAASAPPSTEKAARDAFERGRVFYDAGAFDQASAAFEEAHRLSGRDALLYNVYLAYRDANQPAKAAEALRGYLAKVPNIENRAQLQARLAALDQGLAREREQQQAQARAVPLVAAPVVEAAPPAPAPIEPAASERPARSLRFWAGVSLASVGGALMLSSIATGVLAHSDQQKLKDHCMGKVCDASLKDTADSGKRLAHTTDGLLFGGLAVAAGGAALLFLFGGLERDPRATPPVTAACWSHGCVAETTLRF